MKELVVEYQELDRKNYMRRPASKGDYGQLVKEPAKLYDQDGQLIVVYDHIESPVVPIQVLKSINYRSDLRTQGLKHTSRTFGYSPRFPLRNNFCTAAALNDDHTEALPLLFQLCAQASQTYRQEFPQTYQQHAEKTEKILDDWKIKGTPFTSGIINHTTALSYHLDAGNFQDVKSCMVVYKSKVGGGYLCLPEYNVALECANHTSVVFNGQKVVHGVSPIVKFTPDAYRYSIVFYSLEKLWECLPLEEELSRVRQQSMQRAKERQHDPKGLPYAGASHDVSIKDRRDAIMRARAAKQ